MSIVFGNFFLSVLVILVLQKLEIFAASQFAYLYYVLKVCTLFVKKKYILLSM